MRKIPNQRACLAGSQHDVTVTLTSFVTRGKRMTEKFCSVLLTGGSSQIQADVIVSTRFTVFWGKEGYSLRAGILV